MYITDASGRDIISKVIPRQKEEFVFSSFCLKGKKKFSYNKKSHPYSLPHKVVAVIFGWLIAYSFKLAGV